MKKRDISCSAVILDNQSFSDHTVYQITHFQREKMNALQKLQHSFALKTKPYYGFSKLPLGYHEIICFHSVKNKFAKKDECKKTVLIELKDQVVYLPKYFAEDITEDDVTILNSDGEIKYLYLGGKRENR